MERMRAGHREEAERVPARRVRERQVELPLDLAADDAERICPARQDFEHHLGRTALVVEPAVPAVEHEAGEAVRFEHPADPLRDRHLTERPRDEDDVHGIVRMHVAPPQHHPLEEIEPARHAVARRLQPPDTVSARFARMSRCASRHQCFFTLYQMSAACTMLRVSRSSPAGSASRGPRGE